MSKLYDIFIAKRAIKDIKKICSHYENCVDCPLFETGICDDSCANCPLYEPGICDDSLPSMWNIYSRFKEKRN